MFRLLLAAAAVACALAPAAVAATPQLKYPRQVSFGTLGVGSTGEQVVTLTNTSSGALAVYLIGVSSNAGSFLFDFANDNCVGAVLAPGASCTYGILFTPTVSGRQIGTSDVVFGTSGSVLIKLSGHAK